MPQYTNKKDRTNLIVYRLPLKQARTSCYKFGLQQGKGAGSLSPLTFPLPPQSIQATFLTSPGSASPLLPHPSHSSACLYTHILEATVKDLQLFARELGLLLQLLQTLGPVTHGGQFKFILHAICRE